MFISDKKSLSRPEKKYTRDDFDYLYTYKKLGVTLKDNETTFRLFAPSPVKVVLCLFEKVDSQNYMLYDMSLDDAGVWEITLRGNYTGYFYGYKVYHKDDDLKNGDGCLIIDPYSKAVATYNTYMNPRKSLIIEDDYDWEGDTWVQTDWRDLIIYEMHIRDMTAHPTSGSSQPGTYKGLIERNIKGGLEYIKALGVNAVEFLPVQEFGNLETPFKKELAGRKNHWNPYERNHWGYMTAAYFAPEAYYSEDWSSFQMNTWMGTTGSQVNDFKDVVKTFHNEGIAVIMDVVYNHFSEYESCNLKELDKEYYFRLDNKGKFISESFCGNDLKTERAMVRRLIIDSILFWMQEYHIDGFRFDLGNLLDWKTIEDIIAKAKELNPYAIFITEPWGGGYDPQGFSARSWASWNDQIRNGIKGENPLDGKGWIFGRWYGDNNKNSIKGFLNGSLDKFKNGFFKNPVHSVNYLESHDGYTLGDFIRLALKKVNKDERIENPENIVKLSAKELKLHKLAALFLFVSQGIVMVHAGQEFAETKVISPDTNIDDLNLGKLDRDSYNKDNETNYLNYKHAEINKELKDYYTGLISLRKKYTAFRRANPDDIKCSEFLENEFALAVKLQDEGERFFIMFNANQKNSAHFELPSGKWEILVNEKSAGTKPLGTVNNRMSLKPLTGVVLRKISS